MRNSEIAADSDSFDYGSYQNLVDAFERACREYSEMPAFSCMGRTISYQEIAQAVDNFAAYLQHHTSLAPGDRIAVQLPNVIQYPIAVFGAMKIGLIVVNTNPLYTPEEMEHQFTDAGVKGVVVLANMAHNLEKVIAVTQIDTVIVTELADLHSWRKRMLINTLVKYVKKAVPPYQLPGSVSFIDALKLGAKSSCQPVAINTEDIAVLQYTGGTTGVAKGAVLTHGNILANTLQVRDMLGDITELGREVAIAPLPLYHIYSFTLHCMLMMELGAHVVLITNPRDIPAFVKELKKWRFTIFSGLNTLFVALCKNSHFQSLDFSGLKLTLSGGMALTPSAAEVWQNITDCQIAEGYGLTETSPVVSINPPGAIQMGTIGQPISSTEVQVVDEQNKVLADGETGELCVRGPQVMHGYWNKPDETALVLNDQGWLKTGDIAQIQGDGYIRIVDRKKDMINVSGFSVYPNEIEAVISSHPTIDECVAIGLPDDKTGESIKLFAISSHPGLTEKDVQDFARQHLTSYKVPHQVEFCHDLPRTNVGKVLRRVLREAELNRLS